MTESKKTIFFLVPFYLGLYKDMVTELEKTYTVYVFEDKIFKSKYGLPDTLQIIKKCIKYLYALFFNPWEKYWKKIIKYDSNFNRKYDIFFCINGYSFHPVIIEHLQSINPQIKTVLYLWDITSYFDCASNFKYFHKVVSFDRYDAKKFSVNYLPNYWIDHITIKPVEKKEGVFFLGVNHDDRYWILKKVIEQLDDIGYPYYIKLVVNYGKKPVIISYIEYFYYLILQKKDKLEYWKIYYGRYIPPFAVPEPVPPEIYNRLIEEYDCILDTERPGQTGLTPRTIWALSQNKKIITTNKHIMEEPFYNKDMILIIDRNNPVIPESFLRKKIEINIKDAILNLRIDNWINNIIGEQ